MDVKSGMNLLNFIHDPKAELYLDSKLVFAVMTHIGMF